MKFDIENYKDNRYAMKCKSARESDRFRYYLDSIGRKYRSGDSYSELNYWDDYDGVIYYFFNTGEYSTSTELVREFEDIVLCFNGFEWE